METTEMTRCRSPRPNPQNHTSDDDDTMAPCSSLRLHPQIPESEECCATSCPCRLIDDEDMLWEILIRLPPQPSSLPRVSAVCKRWRGVVNDPRFLREFYAHHRKPPVLGVFEQNYHGIMFNPVLGHPDRIPPHRLNLVGWSSRHGYGLLDCRHGRILVEDWAHNDVIVCNPITGEQYRVAIPPEFRRTLLSGAVLCAAADLDHVHHGRHSSPFKLVLLSTGKSYDDQTLAYVYSSETNIWGNLVSVEAPCLLFVAGAPLIGNCLYWLSCSDGILEFDLKKNSLTFIMEPPVTNNISIHYENRQIIQSESGVLGFAILCYPQLYMWQRYVGCQGVATWMPWNTVEVHSILGLPLQIEEIVEGKPVITGYDEDTNEIFLHVEGIVYMVHLKSMLSRKLYKTVRTERCHPFKSFYTPGNSTGLCG